MMFEPKLTLTVEATVTHAVPCVPECTVCYPPGPDPEPEPEPAEG